VNRRFLHTADLRKEIAEKAIGVRPIRIDRQRLTQSSLAFEPSAVGQKKIERDIGVGVVRVEFERAVRFRVGVTANAVDLVGRKLAEEISFVFGDVGVRRREGRRERRDLQRGCTAPEAVGNSSIKPSPAVLKMRPSCAATARSMRARIVSTAAKATASSASASREYPVISMDTMLASLRAWLGAAGSASMMFRET
jgi:hypothetical protein